MSARLNWGRPWRGQSSFYQIPYNPVEVPIQLAPKLQEVGPNMMQHDWADRHVSKYRFVKPVGLSRTREGEFEPESHQDGNWNVGGLRGAGDILTVYEIFF